MLRYLVDVERSAELVTAENQRWLNASMVALTETGAGDYRPLPRHTLGRLLRHASVAAVKAGRHVIGQGGHEQGFLRAADVAEHLNRIVHGRGVAVGRERGERARGLVTPGR